MKQHRILFIAPLPPPVHGSAVVSKQIKESKMINETFLCDWVNMSTSRRLDEIGKASLIKPIRLIGALLKTIYNLTLHRYALCYLAITCHGKGFLKDVPFVLLCKLFGRKIVIHQHNKGMAEDVDRWPYRWLFPLCYKEAKVILLSWYLYPDIEKMVPRENVVICPNGIPDVKYEYKKRDNPVPHLLFLSNLIPSKGVFVLLDALKILQEKGLCFVCDFVGGETKEINTRRFVEEVNKRQLNKLVVYHGRKHGKEKEKYFCKSDIFVFPSMEDCFPLVLLEAMSYKLPIVTTSEGAIPDEVEGELNGLISEKNNAESLASCISRLIDDPILRSQMGENGFKKLNNCFTEELFEKKLKTFC